MCAYSTIALPVIDSGDAFLPPLLLAGSSEEGHSSSFGERDPTAAPTYFWEEAPPPFPSFEPLPPSYSSLEVGKSTSMEAFPLCHALLWAFAVATSLLIGGAVFTGIYLGNVDPTSALLVALGCCCFANASALSALIVGDFYDPRNGDSSVFDDKQGWCHWTIFWFTAALDVTVLYLVIRILYSAAWGELILRVGDYLRSPELRRNIPHLLTVSTGISLITLQALGSLLEAAMELLLIHRLVASEREISFSLDDKFHLYRKEIDVEEEETGELLTVRDFLLGELQSQV